MFLAIFELMTSLNESHALILMNMFEHVQEIKRLKVCGESTCDGAFEMAKNMQLESMYEFYFTKNGYLVL